MNMAQLLRGTRILKDQDGLYAVQTIQNMALAFLTCDEQFSLDDEFENPLTALHVSNQSYGQLDLRNTTDKSVIVAPQAAFMTTKSAQNHALPKSAAVPAGRSVRYDDAGCVQGSQPGHLDGSTEVRFMPLSVREMLLQEVNKTGEYSHLYATVRKVGQRTGVNTEEYIDRYYNHDFSRSAGIDLQQFIAHFERPIHTIGVVVLVDGEIIAVDKFPSFRYTAQVWDLLVRDCYGSVAIESILKGAARRPIFTQMLGALNRLPDESFVDFMRRCVVESRRSISQEVYDRLSELMTVDFTTKPDINTTPQFQSVVLESDGYIGQAIGSGAYNHLVSIIKRERFDPATIRTVIAARHRYDEMAAAQQDFSL